MTEKSNQKKLLSIDGGGIRGLISLRVLYKIESMLRDRSGNKNLVLSDYFDYIAGTSTGGVIAAALAIGMSVNEIEKFYKEDASKLFAPSGIFKRYLYAKYKAGPLAERLQSVFGEDTTLGSSKLKTLLMLVMLNASTSSPWPVSNNPNGKYNNSSFGLENNLNIPLWQLIRASAAAPIYFEPEEIKIGNNNFIFYDGALTSLNNPAFKLFQMATLPCYQLEWPTGEDKILLVSIGTGMEPQEVAPLKWFEKQGLTTVKNTLLSLMCTTTTEVDMQCRSLGRVLAGYKLDSEVGDFIGSVPLGDSPLFTYMRYDTLLTKNELKSLGCWDIVSKVKFHIDNLKSIDACSIIGNAVAEKYVKEEDFKKFS